MRKTVGIPRALLYHRYFEMWRALFNALDFEVITSAASNEAILKEGLRRSVADLCLPVKAMLGHVASLKERVDYLFIPRYVSVEKDAYMCPKFLGLPDIVRASMSKLPLVIDPVFNAKEDDAVDKFVSGISEAVKIKKRRVKDAYIMTEKTAICRHDLSRTDDYREDSLKIAVIGRPYLIFDEYLSKGIIRSLRSLGACVITDEPSAQDIASAMAVLPKWIYWSMGKEVTASAYKCFRDPSVNGVINLSNATCGPDSFTSEIINRLNRENPKPYMNISIDEHASVVGIQTRIEAFLDMINFSHERIRI